MATPTDNRVLRARDAVVASSLFDSEWYLRNYPDVAAAGVDPALHYVRHGAAERREPGPGFGARWYLERHPDVAAAGLNPLLHYLDCGAAEGRETRPAGAGAQVSAAPPGREGALRVLYVSGEPDTPGHRYRVERPAAAARVAGAETIIVPIQDIGSRLAEVAAADVLVLWRTLWGDGVAAAVQIARGVGARVVFDVDDLMVDPALARIEVIDGIRTQDRTEAGTAAHFEGIRRSMLRGRFVHRRRRRSLPGTCASR